MAYIIYNSDNSTILANIANGDIDDSTTSLDLIGKNVDNYGQYFNNDLVKLLTNFASPAGNEPRSPQVGQLWFNSTTKRLTVYDGTSFKPTYGAVVSGTESITTSTGDLWYDTINSQLKIWNGYSYKLIGPSVSGLYGKFGIDIPNSAIRDYDTNVPKTVGIIYSYGRSMAVFNTSSFLMSAKDSSTDLGANNTQTLVSGLTIANNLDIRGEFFIKGENQLSSNKILTASFDISSYGDPADPDVPTAKSNIEAGNIAISNMLALVYSTSTNTYFSIQFPANSDARVTCFYNGAASVRRFHLVRDPLHASIMMWRWWDLYYSTTLSSYTNIVAL
jgi:hypothetical protein